MYKPICYRAKTKEELIKVPEKLFEYLDMIGKYISKKYNKPRPIIITKDEEIEFQKSDICHICECIIKGKKVRDHCHITGKYRGPAHNKCNLNLKLPQNIPVFCHNSSNYDTHLFIKELAKKYGKIDLIANTDEKYINYTINSGFGYEFENNKPRKFVKLSFVDTFRFMASSIEKLAKGLRKEDCKHIINYINNNEIFNDDEETFEKLRSVCLTNYHLDPAHYLTAPSLAWDAMLKLTDVKLDLISDYDMYLMIEKGIRGGVSQCIKRYCKANNKYVKDYDPEKPENYMLYVDANNLYGWALSQKLPYKGISWMKPGVYTLKEWEETILELDENAEYGYILEVDLEYPKELHNIHKDFPFAPEHYNNKLCTTLLDKTDYVVHSRNLKYYLKQGLKLTKVSRVIYFDQDDYMKKYIEHNTNMRTKAKSDFEKDFFKLMNNSVFGKSMENVRNRCDIRLGNEEYSLKQAKKSNFKSFKIFDKNCIATHMIKTKVKFDKPIYIGFATLDLSKLLMYEFFYDKLKMYDPDLNLLYMDTDSFFVELKKDPYKIIKDNSKEFDTSDYNKDHECYNLTNKKVIGKFKDELNGIPLEEYCGLRSKLYSYTYANKNPVRCKGIKKSVVDKTIKMTDLKKCLFEDVEQFREMNCIRAYKHEVYTVSMNKLALSPKDDKRIICENKIDTVPYGY